jgi:5-oxoprolinase (ATP-hydrolysing) subunit A
LVDRVDTLCLHGDSPGALAMALAVRSALSEAGVTVAAMRQS